VLKSLKKNSLTLIFILILKQCFVLYSLVLKETTRDGADLLNLNNKKPIILIVEDSIINSRFCESLLKKNGFETEVCTDGESALEFLTKNSPDLILLDIIMPGIDGYQFSESIKSNPRLKDTPVIFLSAMNDEESIIKGFKSGGVDFIT
jgi:PleD family two-component response regulator